MKTEITNKLAGTFYKAKLSLKKHSPEILVVSGIVGTVASTVMACKATTKLDGILAESKEKIDTIHETLENPDMLPEDAVYTEEDSKKDLAVTYVQTGVKVAKLYAPAVALGTVSIVSILAGHNITRKRNVALAAAYTVVDKSFKDYRGRVIERFGEELDRELKYNIKAEEVEKVVVDEKGKEKKVKETVQVVDSNDIGYYAKFFDVGNPNWTKDPEANLMFLRHQQDYMNHKLQLQKYLFLNDVYEALGIDKTQAGQIVGWIYDEENPNGDNFVDFGIYDRHDAVKRLFVNGSERTILLDFNVDGPIYDKVF